MAYSGNNLITHPNDCQISLTIINQASIQHKQTMAAAAYPYETPWAEKRFKENRSFFNIPVYREALIVTIKLRKPEA